MKSLTWHRRCRSPEALLFIGMLALAFDLTGVDGTAQAESEVAADELLTWPLWGIGEVAPGAEAGTVELTEGLGSGGVVLLSPEPLPRDSVVRFDIKPQRYEGVAVVFLSASPVTGPGPLDPGENYDGAIKYWVGEDAPVQSYMVGFHTGFHQPYAFIHKNPGDLKLAQSLDIATEQRWYAIEVGRRGGQIWLKIDGEPLVRAHDPEPDGLPAGCLGLRLRGPGDGTFSALYRNLRFAGGP